MRSKARHSVKDPLAVGATGRRWRDQLFI